MLVIKYMTSILWIRWYCWGIFLFNYSSFTICNFSPKIKSYGDIFKN